MWIYGSQVEVMVLTCSINPIEERSGVNSCCEMHLLYRVNFTQGLNT